MDQEKTEPIFRNTQKLSMFLLAIGIFLLIYGRLLGLGPDWFWQDWQKDLTFYYTNFASYVSLLIYTSGFVFIIAGALILVKDVLRDMNGHKLSYGAMLTIIGLILLVMLIMNTTYTFMLADFVQESISVTWVLRAFFLEFLVCSILSTSIGIILLLVFGFSKTRSATSLSSIKRDLNDYSSILTDPIKSHKRIALGATLAIFGFIYLLFGAWPDMEGKTYMWQWQTQIAELGGTIVWILYIISFVAFGIGSFMLYQKRQT